MSKSESEFHVEITTHSYHDRAFSFVKSCGLCQLDQARSAIGSSIKMGQLPKDFRISQNLTLGLTEGQARQSGHFSHQTEVHVYVKPSFCNQWTKLKYTMSEEGKVGIDVEIDTQAVLKAWAEAGYPKYWGFPDDDDDNDDDDDDVDE